jgi:hypothetical protein
MEDNKWYKITIKEKFKHLFSQLIFAKKENCLYKILFKKYSYHKTVYTEFQFNLLLESFEEFTPTGAYFDIDSCFKYNADFMVFDKTESDEKIISFFENTDIVSKLEMSKLCLEAFSDEKESKDILTSCLIKGFIDFDKNDQNWIIISKE